MSRAPTQAAAVDMSALAAQLSEALSAALMAPVGDGDEGTPLTVMPAARATAPERLASAHPGGPAGRAQALALYQRCLAHYRSHVQRGLPEDDVGAAAAYFALACLAALQRLDVSEPQLALVERQMRRIIGGHPAWHQATAVERQALFEQFAVLGVLVGESQHEARSQGAAARANVARAAHGYLRRLLGLNPDALRLGDQGLTLSVELPASVQAGATTEP